MLLAVPTLAGQPAVGTTDLLEGFSLTGQWRFKPGDNMAWADPDFDDSQWGSQAVPGRWEKGRSGDKA